MFSLVLAVLNRDYSRGTTSPIKLRTVSIRGNFPRFRASGFWVLRVPRQRVLAQTLLRVPPKPFT